jgi:SAM-dependent methyltransferase
MMNALLEIGRGMMRSVLGATGYTLTPKGHVKYDPNIYGVYDLSMEDVYNLKEERVIPRGQAIYDPTVFGRYDLASQRIVSKSKLIGPELSSYDVLMAEAQRYARLMPLNLESDRYRLILTLLGPGKGICLDACTPQPLDWAREAISALGYEYVPIDLRGDDVKVRREDLLQLRFADGSVSRIISADTLEHIGDYKQAVAELYRVLCEDGIALFHVPCYYFDRAESEPIEPQVDPWGHVRYFSAKELVTSLAEAGFIILRLGLQFDYGAVLCMAAKCKGITNGDHGR